MTGSVDCPTAGGIVTPMPALYLPRPPPLGQQLRYPGPVQADVVLRYCDYAYPPPVDPVEVALCYGVPVYQYAGGLQEDLSVGGGPPKEQPDAEIEYGTDGTAAIWVRGDHPMTRQRFSVAHELGHYFLHGRTSFRDTVNQIAGTDLREMAANAWAADLLMPAEWVRKAIRDLGTTDVDRLAALFGRKSGGGGGG